MEPALPPPQVTAVYGEKGSQAVVGSRGQVAEEDGYYSEGEEEYYSDEEDYEEYMTDDELDWDPDRERLIRCVRHTSGRHSALHPSLHAKLPSSQSPLCSSPCRRDTQPLYNSPGM